MKKRLYECNTLQRFPDLKPRAMHDAGNKSHVPAPLQKPPWVCSPKRQTAIDAMSKLLAKPSQWPEISVMFQFDGGMGTAEALLKCGPVGQYQYQWLDCAPDYRELFIANKIMFETAMRKSSTPAERVFVAEAAPRLFTKLEMKMPTQYQTTVRHLVAFHIVDNLEELARTRIGLCWTSRGSTRPSRRCVGTATTPWQASKLIMNFWNSASPIACAPQMTGPSRHQEAALPAMLHAQPAAAGEMDSSTSH